MRFVSLTASYGPFISLGSETESTGIGITKGERKMVRRVTYLAIFGLLISVVAAIAADPQKEAAAVSAAEKWLALVDQGKYAESWKEAATRFRSAIQQSQWEQSLQAVRKPLGKLLSRKVKTKTYSTSLTGAPDGEYVVIQFETSFEHKKQAVETVTPSMDQDGQWRVSGYYIK